jgi:manganese/zinc/iron transport system permease protein
LALARRRVRQKWEFAQTMLAIHLYQHEKLPEAAFECSYAHLDEHMRWSPDHADKVVYKAQREKVLKREGDMLMLTDKGRDLARQSLVK